MNRGRIVVGLDGSREATDALRWAIAEATVRGGQVQVLTVLKTPTQDHFRMERMQTMLIDAATKNLPDHPHITQRGVIGAVAPELARASCGADLLVIGRHRVPITHDAATGPIAEYCLRTAHCPVVIVPDRDAFAVRAGTPADEHYRWRSHFGEL